jgi:hypothetical protein
MASRPHATPQARERHDYGALEQRVYGTERKIDDLSTQTTRQIESVRTELSAAVDRISTKIDNQQTFALTTGRTDWKAFASAASAVVGVIMSVGAAVIIPINGEAARNFLTVERLKETSFTGAQALEMKKDFTHWIDAINADKVGKPQYDEAIGDLKSRVAALEASDAKTANVDAANHAQDLRADALSARLNDLQTQFSSLFPASELIKEIWAQLRETRVQTTPAISPVLPNAPRQ